MYEDIDGGFQLFHRIEVLNRDGQNLFILSANAFTEEQSILAVCLTFHPP